ncbi:MAG: carboxypeptidase regulatory-like domain-containing protein [Deltaproteobacteria bacterium]|nr:carboxypeptidase regulatory-like domain-containing protein [Deltaproteobacteria bacterium]
MRSFWSFSLIGVLTLVFGGLALMLVGSPPASADPTGSIAGEVSARPAKNRADVVVHVVKAAGSFRPPAQQPAINQKAMKFAPHVLAILRGTTVRFLNNDNVRHNVFSPDGGHYDLGTWGQGETRTRVFAQSGVYRQLCNIHPEMSAFIVVLDNPYFAVTNGEGRFRIDGVPPGSYTLRAWSERLREATQPVTVTAGGTTNIQMELAR